MNIFSKAINEDNEIAQDGSNSKEKALPKRIL